MSDNTLPAFTLGDRLAKARKHAGIGSEQMAGLLGVSRTSISNYEAGRTSPPLHVVLDWSKETDVPLSWLIGAEADTPTSRSSSVRATGDREQLPLFMPGGAGEWEWAADDELIAA